MQLASTNPTFEFKKEKEKKSQLRFSFDLPRFYLVKTLIPHSPSWLFWKIVFGSSNHQLSSCSDPATTNLYIISFASKFVHFHVSVTPIVFHNLKIEDSRSKDVILETHKGAEVVSSRSTLLCMSFHEFAHTKRISQILIPVLSRKIESNR